MKTKQGLAAFKTCLSIDPLISFWREKIAPSCPHMAEVFAQLEERIKAIPELQGAIENPSILAKYDDLLMPLMSVVFPGASWESDIAGASLCLT